VRLAQALLRPKTLWLSFEPPEIGQAVGAATYVQAIADTESYGSRWLVSLDAHLRAGLSGRTAAARETWATIGRALDFFAKHRAWSSYRPPGPLGVMSDHAGANQFLSFEVQNLLARRGSLYRLIEKSAASDLSDLEAVLYVDQAPPEPDLARRLLAFVEAGGTLVTPPGWDERGVPDNSAWLPRFRSLRLGRGRLAVARSEFADPYVLAEDAQLLMSHRHDRIRVFNPGTAQFHYATSADSMPLEEYMYQAGWDAAEVVSAGRRVELENTNWLGRAKDYHRFDVPGTPLLFPSYLMNHSFHDCDARGRHQLRQHRRGGDGGDGLRPDGPRRHEPIPHLRQLPGARRAGRPASARATSAGSRSPAPRSGMPASTSRRCSRAVFPASCRPTPETSAGPDRRVEGFERSRSRMRHKPPRRHFFGAAGAFALAPAVAPSLASSAAAAGWPPSEGPGTLKLCLGLGRNADASEMRRFKQIGVDHVLMGGPPIPWREADLRALVERFRAGGQSVANLMISGFPNTIYGRPGRDEPSSGVVRDSSSKRASVSGTPARPAMAASGG
jgi:hypothetical protein